MHRNSKSVQEFSNGRWTIIQLPFICFRSCNNVIILVTAEELYNDEKDVNNNTAYTDCLGYGDISTRLNNSFNALGWVMLKWQKVGSTANFHRLGAPRNASSNLQSCWNNSQESEGSHYNSSQGDPKGLTGSKVFSY